MSKDDQAVKARKLGRGLSSLLGDSVRVSLDIQAPPVAEAQDSYGVAHAEGTATAPPTQPLDDGRRLIMVGIEALIASPYQPRREFDEEAIKGLAESMKTAGVMQPVLVRAGRGDGRYELIAGERRWRAARLAGLREVPAVLVELSDVEAAEWSLIENVQREDLGPIERAWAYKNLADRFALTHAQIAQKLGLDRTVVTNFIRLLDLEPLLQDLIVSDRLSVGHGKALLGLEVSAERQALGERACREHWSVRRLEREVDLLKAGTPRAGQKEPSQRSLAVREMEKVLSDQLGTKVTIATQSGGKKGRIVAEFYSLDHFEGLMARMGVRANRTFE